MQVIASARVKRTSALVLFQFRRCNRADMKNAGSKAEVDEWNDALLTIFAIRRSRARFLLAFIDEGVDPDRAR